MRKVADEINKCYLCQENQGKSILELLMHRLMMPNLHAKQSPDATAENSKYQQSCFRYAPAALLSLPLINAIDQKGHDIDEYKIIIVVR